MKKIHLKRKSLGISSIVVITLLLLFFSAPLAHADLPDPHYYIGSFDLQTRTYAGSSPQTYFWFTIHDANYYHARHLESVVESATITYPGGTPQPVTPELIPWCFTERRSTDHNQDGTIDPYEGEYEIIANCGSDYEVLSHISPHVAGDYQLLVHCNNGDVLPASLTAFQDGKTASELPPVTNVEASFNDDGLLQVSWDLPPVEYPEEKTIQIRVDLYKKKRGMLYQRYSVGNLPHNQTIHTFFKWESDIIRLFSRYIDVKVRTYQQESMTQSKVRKYKVKKLLKQCNKMF